MKECTAASEWMQFFNELDERQLRTLTPGFLLFVFEVHTAREV
ncbi:hypothetical protein V7200_12850 [Cytobacillus firmus]|uniref:Uncharacterized protein n=2 Tax=Cytobacillus firmus TaxID=1399 RepID=A0A800NBA2_CYTFI|nr:hypothetical protein [Cytobacillus firmus]KAF0824722.1 hypothetical protein KIS1582_1485 [Cytobacillus firmus]